MNRFDPTQPVEYRFRGATPPDPVSEAWERTSAKAIFVIGLGVVLALFSQFVANAKSPIWLAFLAGGLASLMLLYRYFEISLAVLLAICWINFGSPAIASGGSGGGDQRLFVSHLGLGALLFIGFLRLGLHSGTKLDKSRLFPPLLLYLAICIWSTTNSFLFPNQAVMDYEIKQYFQVNVIEILTRALAIGGVILIASTLRGKYLRYGMVAILVPGTLALAGVNNIIPTGSAWFSFIETLTMAVYWSFALNKETAMKYRLLGGTAAMLLFSKMFLLNTEWVSGWLGAGTALLLITFNANRRLFWAGIAAILLIIAVNFPYFYEKMYVANFYTKGHTTMDGKKVEGNTLDNDRLRMLMAATKYATYFPLGIGCGNYRSYNNYFGRPDVWNTTTFTSAHGTYAQTLSETGWLGLFALLWVVITAGKLLFRYYKALPDGVAKTYMLGAWGGVVGIFAASFNGDYLFPTYHNGGLWFFGVCVYVWLMIGVAIALARENNLQDTPEKKQRWQRRNV
jgi:hypothetical protein